MWQLNPLLGKTVLDLVAQRAYHKDEIYKQLGSAAYRGIVPSRPALETWLQIALGSGPAAHARHRGHHRPARGALRRSSRRRSMSTSSSRRTSPSPSR